MTTLTLRSSPILNTPFGYAEDDAGRQYPVLVVHPDSSALGGGTAATAADRELVVTLYRCITAATGMSVGDVISHTQVVDVSTTPSTVATIWRNQSTNADLASAPSAANLEVIGATGLTNAQFTAAGLSTETTLAAILAKLTADPATQATLAALLAKVSGDQATDTTLAAVGSVLTSVYNSLNELLAITPTPVDSTGLALPLNFDYLPEARTFDTSGNLLTQARTNGTNTWTITHTYVGSNCTNSSAWVKS